MTEHESLVSSSGRFGSNPMDGSGGVPMSAYSVRELEEQKAKALHTWNTRVRICFAVQLLVSACLLRSYYWFTTVIGFVIVIGCYVYSYVVRQKRHEFALAYLLLVTLNFVKNVVIVYFYLVGPPLDAYEVFLVVLLIIDSACFGPATLYCCFYLYRSQSLTALSF